MVPGHWPLTQVLRNQGIDEPGIDEPGAFQGMYTAGEATMGNTVIMIVIHKMAKIVMHSCSLLTTL